MSDSPTIWGNYERSGSLDAQDGDSAVVSLAHARGAAPTYAVIDSRRLERECFVRSIELLHKRVVLIAYADIDEFFGRSERAPRPGAVILNIGGHIVTDPETTAALQDLVARGEGVPVVVLAEVEDVAQAIAAIDCGASGYITTSIGIDAIIEACKLAAAGGVVLPPRGLEALRAAVAGAPAKRPDYGDAFTGRQSAVAEALRTGKANKTIAYDLNMCESTVKVHIRNILKKLRASNRTEAAFKLNALRGGEPRH